MDEGFSHLVEVFRGQAAERPRQIGFTYLEDGEEHQIDRTYAELDLQARGIAARLQALGGEGRRALLMYDPGLDYIAAFAGCLYAKVVAVPLYPPDPLRAYRTLPRLQAVVRDAQADIILTTRSILEWADTLFGNLVGVETIVATDEILAGDRLNELAEKWQAPELDRSTLAFLQYTSGSTGEPKGVMVSHGNLLTNLWQFQQTVDRQDAVVVTWLPAYHDMGLIGGILECWYSGRRNIQLSPLKFFQRPYRWLRAISHYRATTSASPNFGFDLCVRKITAEERATLDLSSWRIAMNGAEPVRPETMERFCETFAPCGVRPTLFYPCYGLAEATLMVSGGRQEAGPIIKSWNGQTLVDGSDLPAPASNGDEPTTRRIVGCGQSVPSQRIAIVDPESLRPVDTGRVGEVWVSGPNVALGYWRRPEISEQIFRAHTQDGDGPFLRTGDIGFVDAAGELFITGRLKDLIIVFGRNHYPQDIEQTVEGCHAALKQYGGAAFSVEMGGEERLVIVHELMRPQRVDVDGVIATIRQRVLEEHQIPVEAIVLIKPGTIPKTSSGKIQRRACREMYLDGRLQVVGQWQAEHGPTALAGAMPEYVAPRNATEELIASLWSEVLGVSRVGIHDRFFELGGNSLLASQLVSRLAPYFHNDVPLHELFERPTVAELAELLDRSLATRPDGESVAAALARLDAMTDEEAERLLAEGPVEETASPPADENAPGRQGSGTPPTRSEKRPVTAAPVERWDYLIIGAGPGGLQMGYYLEKAGRRYKILEMGPAAATFLTRFPRRRRLLSINKINTGCDDPEINLRWDWNSLLSENHELLFKQFSDEFLPPADKLVEYLNSYASHFGLNVQYDTHVVRIEKDQQFEVQDQLGRRYRAEVLIVATGCQAPYLPPIPGIEQAEDYSRVSLEPRDFLGQKVLILGKGNSAFEIADNLLASTSLIHLASPSPLKVAWQSHYAGHLRAVNSGFLDAYQLQQRNALFDARVERIRRLENGRMAVSFEKQPNGERQELQYDRVIACTGFRFDPAMFTESCRPKLVFGDRLPEQTSHWESTRTQGMFFAGSLMQMRDYKRKQSGFVHGFRYNIRLLHQLLEQKLHGQELPWAPLETSPEAIARRLLGRVQGSSSLWRQAGFLCDVAAFPDEGAVAEYSQQVGLEVDEAAKRLRSPRYYRDLTVELAHELWFGSCDRYYTLTMEYGEGEADGFVLGRQMRSEPPRPGAGVHPVVRRYSRGELLREHHFGEDLAGEWRDPHHLAQLTAFLVADLPSSALRQASSAATKT